MTTDEKIGLGVGLAALAAGVAYYFFVYSKTKKAAGNANEVISKTIAANTVQPNEYEGQLLRGDDGPKVYLITGGYKQWIHDPDVLAKLGYSFSQVNNVSHTILDAIPSGATLSGLRELLN